MKKLYEPYGRVHGTTVHLVRGDKRRACGGEEWNFQGFICAQIMTGMIGEFTPVVLVFARPPVQGQVKRRLAAAVGDEQALGVYRRLLAHTLEQVRGSGLEARIWWSQHLSSPGYSEWTQYVQEGNDLGERMDLAIRSASPRAALLIGSDCPGLRVAHLVEAAGMLRRNEVVFGPAADGGYYLVGTRNPQPWLFADMEWSTSGVLSESIRRCRLRGLSIGTLPMLRDVDTVSDLDAMSELN